MRLGQTDPQQRIFLEGVWHALEDAAIPPRSLIDSETGVFVGATTHDYASEHIRSVAPADIDRYSALGLALNAIAGRVSYVFGLHGPSMCIDSACSSSLVAVDRACRSLREGECSLAIAGGVNILAFSDSLIAASRWGMLSSSGRVLSFGRGDGFVRGEGCGVVVLKRLRAAGCGGRPCAWRDPWQRGQPRWSRQRLDSPERTRAGDVAAFGTAVRRP